MSYPIIDLHCDLLFYLSLDPKRGLHDPASRCSIPQLKQGNVKLQTLAIFTRTDPTSVEEGMKQWKILQELLQHQVIDLQAHSSDLTLQSPKISTLIAFENASGFCGEKEPLQAGFKRLEEVMDVSKPLYISLTWNSENRFGGGAHTQIGLKEDGKRLMEEISGKGIAIDLSHTSDALAYEIIDYIENKNLVLPLMASHSNARAAVQVPRNLPDEIAREIFKRKGTIGFNLFSEFIGNHPEDILKHIAHWLELGGENHLSFGADFFNDADFISTPLHAGKTAFFHDYQNASCYQALLSFLGKELRLSDTVLNKIAHQNALEFIKDLQLQSVVV
jgi:microsomal dipeptidase-like Zn-dependent dipeptidase